MGLGWGMEDQIAQKKLNLFTVPTQRQLVQPGKQHYAATLNAEISLRTRMKQLAKKLSV